MKRLKSEDAPNQDILFGIVKSLVIGIAGMIIFIIIFALCISKIPRW